MLERLRLEGTEEQQRFFYGRVPAGERLGDALSETGSPLGDAPGQTEPLFLSFAVRSLVRAPNVLRNTLSSEPIAILCAT
jgi:hypothetical protein